MAGGVAVRGTRPANTEARAVAKRRRMDHGLDGFSIGSHREPSLRRDTPADTSHAFCRECSLETATHMLRTGRRGALFQLQMALRDLRNSFLRIQLAWSLATHDVGSRYR